jgi:hypothetical protein
MTRAFVQKAPPEMNRFEKGRITGAMPSGSFKISNGRRTEIQERERERGRRGTAFRNGGTRKAFQCL